MTKVFLLLGSPKRAVAVVSLLLSVMCRSGPPLPEVTHSNAARPNIIYILVDDLGYGDLGVYGQQMISTPRLDQLAAEGMVFTQHYAGAPVCAPSRASLMAGLHTGHTTIRGNLEIEPEGQQPIPDSRITLAERWI